MTCPTCNQEIPISENKVPQLACPRCLAAKSYQALLQLQREFIAKMIEGAHRMTLTKPAKQVRWHLVLSNYAQAWCGETVNTRWDRQRLEYPKIDTVRTPLCEACQRVFEELAEDQPTEVA